MFTPWTNHCAPKNWGLWLARAGSLSLYFGPGKGTVISRQARITWTDNQGKLPGRKNHGRKLLRLAVYRVLVHTWCHLICSIIPRGVWSTYYFSPPRDAALPYKWGFSACLAKYFEFLKEHFHRRNWFTGCHLMLSLHIVSSSYFTKTPNGRKLPSEFSDSRSLGR